VPPDRGRVVVRPAGYEPGFAESARIDGRAPGVQGRPAYWITGRAFLSGPGQEAARHFLAFQYAAGGWALLDYPARADALRIARTARFGLRAHIRFGAQLQQAPAPWRVTSVGYRRYRSRLTATELLISGAGDQSLRGYPQIFLVPAAQDPDQGCQPVGQHHRTQVINGYRVIVDDGQVVDEATGTPSPDQTVCASTADGLLVRVQVTGDQRPLTAVQVFGRLKLLGPDPAHWTTQPLR
jgi:hypothetical protein